MNRSDIKSFIAAERQAAITNDVSILSGFKVQRLNNTFSIESLNKKLHFKIVQQNFETYSLLSFKRPLLEAIKTKFVTDNIDLIIKIAYFDLYIFLNTGVDISEKYLALFPSLSLIKTQSKFTRSTLFEANKQSVVFDKKTENSEYKKIIDLGFEEVEFPLTFPFKEVERITYAMRDKLLEYDVEHFSLVLRFKKLGLYRLKGLYSAEFNTIIIDPRHTYVWQHELGHYYHVTQGITGIDYEEFANQF